MTKPAERRILGLSPRARRFVVPFVVVAAVLVALAYLSSGGPGESSSGARPVAAEPHADGDPRQRTLNSGSGAAGHGADTGRRTHSSLNDKDVLGSSSSGSKALAAGYGRGLRR